MRSRMPSGDMPDMSMKDCAHGSGWLCHQRSACRGPQRQRRYAKPMTSLALAVRADRPLPPVRRRGAAACVETAALVADAGGARGGGRDRRLAQGGHRSRRRRRRGHDPLSPHSTPSAWPPGGAVGGHDLAGVVPAWVCHPAASQAAPQSWRRFQAELPNECWQADTTHWALADGSDVEILNVIDDHSRLLVASLAFRTAKAVDVVETFHLGAASHGLPVLMLTDNGAIFTVKSRNGTCVIESSCSAWASTTSTPAPTTPRPAGKSNDSTRPRRSGSPATPRQDHRRTASPARPVPDLLQHNPTSSALGRRTPAEAFAARTKATPRAVAITVASEHRVRRPRPTTPARSRFATGPRSCTWASGAATSALASCSSSPTATCESSTVTASDSPNSPSTPPRPPNKTRPGQHP